MEKKPVKSQKWVISFFNFFHSQSQEERMKLAVHRLCKLIVAKGIAHNTLQRYNSPATNAYSPPNNTPENFALRNFLELRDYNTFREKDIKQQNLQKIIHVKSVRTEGYKLAFKYAKRWLKRTNLKSKSAQPKDYSQSEFHKKRRVVDREPPKGIEPKTESDFVPCDCDSGEVAQTCMCVSSKNFDRSLDPVRELDAICKSSKPRK